MGDRAVLLRLAGLPAAMWSAGACPGLFAALADVDAEAAACREHGWALAVRLGERVVPRPEVTEAERQAVLRVRRAAHGGRALPDEVVLALARSAAARVDLPSAVGLDRLVVRVRDLAQGEAGLRDDLAAEQRRLEGLPWRLLRSSPVGSAALAHDAADVVADVRRRLAAGETWSGKRLRQRADHLWRLIARGAVKTTPRSWFGHVAAPAGGPGTLTAGPFATVETPNVHTARAPRDGLSLTGLHWSEDGFLVTWAPREDATGPLREVRVRDTPALGAVRRVLAGGPRSPDEVLTALLGPRADDPAGREALTGFLRHLVDLGVLRDGRRVAERVSAWGPARARARVGEDFLDVHRRVTGAMPVPDVRAAVGVLRRFDALLAADAPGPIRRVVDERPIPVPDLVRRALVDRSPRPTDPGTWPVPRDPRSGYAEVLRRWADLPDEPGGVVDLTEDVLDAAGAPRPVWDWPVDCLVRPLPASGPAAGGPAAVLDCAVPAGVLDARFAWGLRLLHGVEPDGVVAHREFLREFERTAGGRLVEVLVPPHNARSANTVRRPVHTDLWTGDPDPLPYFGEDHPGRHLPLHAITLRREGGEVIAEADGERLWPVHHATRAPVAPWDVALGLLLAAGPRGARRRGWHRPHAITAFPGRRHLPRVTVGPVVVSRAQWRVCRDELWPPDAGVEARFRALGRLTRARSLPRWVFAGVPGGRQVPVDLAGLPALRVLDRVLGAGDELVLVEMLPDPTGSPVVDTAHDVDDRLACQLLVRLPVDDDANVPPSRVGTALVADAVRRETTRWTT
ncbi:lantibiotic dehydratase [Saccharothrix isguenensis]